MRHNKYIGWDTFLSALERVERVSPWLSRQIVKRASEWPFFYSGLQIEEWFDRQVRVRMPFSRRNSVDGEICQGHLLLGAEFTLRLLLLRYRQEFPFSYSLRASRIDVQHALAQDLEYKFEISFEEWERLRLDLAREARASAEFVFHAYLADGRQAAAFTFHATFVMEKFLPL